MMIEKLDKQIEGLGVSMNEKFEELNRKISNWTTSLTIFKRRCQPSQITRLSMTVSKIICLPLSSGSLVTVGGAVAIAVGSPLCNGNDFLGAKNERNSNRFGN